MIREWDLLKDWIQTNREALRRREHIRARLLQWEEQGCDPTLLLPPGLPLEEGRKLLAEHGDVLIDEVQPYIEASITADRAREEAARAAERRRLNRARLVASVMAVLLVAATVLSYSVYDRSVRERAARQTAEQQRQLALSARQLALSFLSGQATQIGNSLKGMLLYIDVLTGSWPSGNRPYTEEPELSLQSAYLANRERAVLPHGDGAPIGLTLFSPDSAHVLTALGSDIISSESAPARIWDTQTGAQRVALEGAISDTHALLPEELAHKRRVQAVRARHLTDAVFSRDGMRLLTVWWKGSVEVWDLKSGATTVSFAYHSDQRVKTAVFSPDEAYIITELTNGDTKKSENAEAGGKYESGSGVATDASGNAYLTGSTYGSLGGANRGSNYVLGGEVFHPALIIRLGPTGR